MIQANELDRATGGLYYIFRATRDKLTTNKEEEMNVQWKGGVLKIAGTALDPNLTLIDSAQCFTWREAQGRYYAALFDRAICLEQIGDALLVSPVAEDEIEDFLHYFDLMRDYGALRDRLTAHPAALRALECLPGLKILNQPPWETLLSFIISANNNVGRIRRLVWLLGAQFGAAYTLDSLTLNALPSPEALAEVGESALRDLGFGYRAPYLIDTARMVAAGFPLEELSQMPYEKAHALLQKLPGVGPKVADCVLLFGCGHASAFPVDVWVERLMRAWFPELAQARTRAALASAARELLGENAGLIQQFLFHCARCGIMEL